MEKKENGKQKLDKERRKRDERENRKREGQERETSLQLTFSATPLLHVRRVSINKLTNQSINKCKCITH